jgi:DNA-binding HxlR family transcriptional regulator
MDPLDAQQETAARSAVAMQMDRGELFAADCPSREVLQHITSRWGVLVLVALLGGMHRFSDLRRKIGGVSEKMLAQTLQALERDGFVARKSYPVVPPRVEYTLTGMGVEVARQVERLADWIEGNLPRILSERHARRALRGDGAGPSAQRRARATAGG